VSEDVEASKECLKAIVKKETYVEVEDVPALFDLREVFWKVFLHGNLMGSVQDNEFAQSLRVSHGCPPRNCCSLRRTRRRRTRGSV
jgi:hypothetical protein